MKKHFLPKIDNDHGPNDETTYYSTDIFWEENKAELKNYLRNVFEKSTDWSAETIAQLLADGKPPITKILDHLINKTDWLKMAAGILAQAGARHLDIEEALSDGLVGISKSLLRQQFRGDSCKLKTYYVKIALNSWKKRITPKNRKNLRILFVESYYKLGNIPDYETPETLALNAEKANLVKKAASMLGSPCKELLLHRASGYSYEEMAHLFGVKNAETSKKNVYACRKKLRALIQKLGYPT